MAFTIVTGNKVLNKILRNVDFTAPTALKVSLHTGDPGENGANEVVGGDYGRKSVAFNAASNKIATSTAVLEWENMPACTVKYVGLWDTEVTPNFWWGGQLQSEEELRAGNTFRIKASNLGASLG